MSAPEEDSLAWLAIRSVMGKPKEIFLNNAWGWGYHKDSPWARRCDVYIGGPYDHRYNPENNWGISYRGRDWISGTFEETLERARKYAEEHNG